MMPRKAAEDRGLLLALRSVLALLASALLLAACSDPVGEQARFDPAALVGLGGTQVREAGEEGLVSLAPAARLPVRYDPALEPRSFRARVNGREATAAFHPRPQSVEVVDLAEHLQPGLNELEFTAAPRRPDGRVGPGRAYTVKVRRTDAAHELIPVMGATVTTPPPSPPPSEAQESGE